MPPGTSHTRKWHFQRPEQTFNAQSARHSLPVLKRKQNANSRPVRRQTPMSSSTVAHPMHALQMPRTKTHRGNSVFKTSDFDRQLVANDTQTIAEVSLALPGAPNRHQEHLYEASAVATAVTRVKRIAKVWKKNQTDKNENAMDRLSAKLSTYDQVRTGTTATKEMLNKLTQNASAAALDTPALFKVGDMDWDGLLDTAEFTDLLHMLGLDLGLENTNKLIEGLFRNNCRIDEDHFRLFLNEFDCSLEDAHNSGSSYGNPNPPLGQKRAGKHMGTLRAKQLVAEDFECPVTPRRLSLPMNRLRRQVVEAAYDTLEVAAGMSANVGAAGVVAGGAGKGIAAHKLTTNMHDAGDGSSSGSQAATCTNSETGRAGKGMRKGTVTAATLRDNFSTDLLKGSALVRNGAWTEEQATLHFVKQFALCKSKSDKTEMNAKANTNTTTKHKGKGKGKSRWRAAGTSFKFAAPSARKLLLTGSASDSSSSRSSSGMQTRRRQTPSPPLSPPPEMGMGTGATTRLSPNRRRSTSEVESRSSSESGSENTDSHTQQQHHHHQNHDGKLNPNYTQNQASVVMTQLRQHRPHHPPALAFSHTADSDSHTCSRSDSDSNSKVHGTIRSELLWTTLRSAVLTAGFKSRAKIAKARWEVTITRRDFEHFYATLSAGIASDKEFVTMVESAWGVPPRPLPLPMASSGACRKVAASKMRP